MNYRLIKIKEYSHEIAELRKRTWNAIINNEEYKKIINDLDILCQYLKEYGNPIRFSIFINRAQMTLEICAYEKDNVFKYKLFHEKEYKEKKKIFITLSPDFSYHDLNVFLDEVKEREMAGKHKINDEYIPLPATSDIKAYLLDNWENIYNEILEKILNKLEKEKSQMVNEVNIIEKYL